MTDTRDFYPNWASMPGDTINDILIQKNLSIDEFSNLIGISLRNTQMLIDGLLSIDNSLAEKLHASIGGSPNFWIRREENYRNSIERLKEEEGVRWLKELPVKDMIRFHWIIPNQDNLDTCLKFFDVPDLWIWRKRYSSVVSSYSFRKSDKIKSNPASLATWIRQGEIQAKKNEVSTWDPEKFKKTLVDIKRLSRLKDPTSFLPKLITLCGACGVAISIVPTPKGCSASGVAKFISDNKALIILSFRHKSDDQFWFTFFHEAGHLLLHGNKKTYVDEEDIKHSTLLEERDANQFAEEVFFPGSLLNELKQLEISEENLRAMANKAGLSLGIVVGQLQHAGKIPLNHYNKMKRRYNWEDIQLSDL